MTNSTEIMADYLNKCVRCGQCRYVCPVLAQVARESAAPRGKVYLAGLLQKREISPGPQSDGILSLCLTCGACTAECPSGLPVDGLIKSARALSASGRPWSPLRLAFRQFFTHQRHLTRLPGVIPLMKKVMAPHWRAAGGPARFGIPFRVSPENKKPRLRVGYFLGCATNYLMPEVALSTVAVLRHLGCEVITPPAQCCGLPLEAAGDPAAAGRLLEENRRLFKEIKADLLVTDCSSCSLQLTEKGLGGGAQPVYEFSELLVTVINPQRPRQSLEAAVAWHHPCHLRYGRKVADQSRQILGLIPGLRPVEVPGGGSCCGGGGTFSLKHPEVSRGILDRSAAGIKSSGAEKVATVCPSCLIQLDRALSPGGLAACHPAQLLRQAYALPG